MRVTGFSINLTTDQVDAMTAFYRDTLGLAQCEMSQGFIVGGPEIHIDGHSQTSGRTKEPSRCLVNLMVEDLGAEQAALEAKGVEFSRKDGREWWGGRISTFSDPDGNILQLIQFDPALASAQG